MTDLAAAYKTTKLLNSQMSILDKAIRKCEKAARDLDKQFKRLEMAGMGCLRKIKLETIKMTENIYYRVSNLIKNITQQIEDFITLLRANMQFQIALIINWVEDKQIVSYLNNLANQIEKFSDKIKQIKDYYDELKGYYSEFKAFKEQYKVLFDTIKTLDKIRGTLKNISILIKILSFPPIKKQIDNLLRVAGGLISRWFPQLAAKMGPLLKTVLSKLGPILFKFLIQIAPKILKWLIPALRIISIVVQILWWVGKLIYNNWDKIVAWFGTIKEKISAKINQLLMNFMAQFTIFKAWLIQKAGDIITAIITKAGELKEGFATKFGEIKENLLTRFTEIKDAIIGKFLEIKENAFQIGKDIVDKLITGIKESPDKLMNAFKSLLPPAVVIALEKAGIVFKAPAANEKSHALGLPYVPYDNYPALLHRGERVLTRAEADQYRKGSGYVVVEKIADSVVIREEADINRLARAFAAQLKGAQLNYGGV